MFILQQKGRNVTNIGQFYFVKDVPLHVVEFFQLITGLIDNWQIHCVVIVDVLFCISGQADVIIGKKLSGLRIWELTDLENHKWE